MASPRDAARVLVIGKDARTDALVTGLTESLHKPLLYGISEFRAPGMLEKCEKLYSNVSLVDVDEIARIAADVRPDLVVIGPEEPLAAGVVDRIEADLDVPCFGPRRELAMIEASKTWTRQLLTKYHIAGNPDYRVFRSRDGLAEYAKSLGNFVVKPDGLTGGKGVKLWPEHFNTVESALHYAHQLLEDDGVVLIEEALEGEEFSLQSLCDGSVVVHTPLIQDHKRAEVGDTGPNTGGMGSYSCADFSLPFLSDEELVAARQINERVAAALKAETGQPYRGVLYGGFIATRNGVRLIEYNCRFGDPEAMNVMPLLESDLLDLCWDVAIGQLNPAAVSFRQKAVVCKYVVPAGYPTKKEAGGKVILDEMHIDPEHARYYWAAVERIGADIVLTGSRAIACVGIGDSVADAEAYAAKLIETVQGPVRHRADIGTEEVLARRVEHMQRIRASQS